MKYRPRRGAAEGDPVNLSPLIDIVFILLIFFMVSTTFVRDMDLDIDRPKAESSTRSPNEAIRLYIDAGGNTFLDGQPVRTWIIQGKLRDMLRGSSSDTVLVVTDEAVPARTLVEVVDQARLSGAADVGVATVREAGRGS